MAICRLRFTVAHGKCWNVLYFCSSAKDLMGDKVDSAGVDWIGHGVNLATPSQNEMAIGI